jgi:hypothetical protein
MPSTVVTPARVRHMLTLSDLAYQLAPAYARTQNNLPGEVLEDVKEGLTRAMLHEPLCDAVWAAMKAARPRLGDDDLLAKLEAATRRGGPRPSDLPEKYQDKAAPLVFLIQLSVAGLSHTEQEALDSPRGKETLARAIKAVADYLAGRLLAASGKKDQPAAG